MKKTITCRPCKDQPGTWEYTDQNGNVMPKHFNSKEECVTAARDYACECGCELNIQNSNRQQSK